MPLRLYNTLTGKKETFTPGDPKHVTMYVCGPTVYSSPHIGNARPAVVFDVLYRLLKAQYPKVTYVRNITDIDDKINAAAREQGIPISTITDTFTRAYHEDVAALSCLSPDIEPRATGHTPQIIAMIQNLIGNGHAYAAEGHVLFHVPSYEKYGQLSRRAREEMLAGARVEVAPYKKDPADFVLWKPSTPDLPGWESPWGRGRPGWHIECSAMIETCLGKTVDIHGGGQDLIFPHHENEIAQGVCAHRGVTYARYWVHNGFVNVNHEKMSKSLGNVLLVRDLLKQAPGEAVRLALLSAHYHQPLDWTEETLPAAKQTLDRFYRALEALADVQPEAEIIPREVIEALNDDLNTPKALAELHRIATEANKAKGGERHKVKAELLGAARFMGLLQQSPESWFVWGGSQVDAAEIERLIKEREEARKRKDFATSDRIRNALEKRGIVLEDSASGTRWRMAGT